MLIYFHFLLFKSNLILICFSSTKEEMKKITFISMYLKILIFLVVFFFFFHIFVYIFLYVTWILIYEIVTFEIIYTSIIVNYILIFKLVYSFIICIFNIFIHFFLLLSCKLFAFLFYLSHICIFFCRQPFIFFLYLIINDN